MTLALLLKVAQATRLYLVSAVAVQLQCIQPSDPLCLCLALTLGAGVQWREAYAAAAEQQRFIVGGISTGMSVGAAGGWVMGGGHSAFSPKYGLGKRISTPMYESVLTYLLVQEWITLSNSQL